MHPGSSCHWYEKLLWNGYAFASDVNKLGSPPGQTVWFPLTIPGSLIIISGYLIWHSRNAPCPTDSKKARACKRLRLANSVIYSFSVLTYILGFFFAFIITKIF